MQKLIEAKHRATHDASRLDSQLQELSITLSAQLRAAEMEAEHDRKRLSSAMNELASRTASEEKLRAEYKALDITSGQHRRELEFELESTRQQRDDFRRKFELLSQEFLAASAANDGESSIVHEQLRLSQSRIEELEHQVRKEIRRIISAPLALKALSFFSFLVPRNEDLTPWKPPRRSTL